MTNFYNNLETILVCFKLDNFGIKESQIKVFGTPKQVGSRGVSPFSHTILAKALKIV